MVWTKVEKTTNLNGQNSFIAPGPIHEYQIDLLFIKYMEDQEYEGGMMCIDVFAKYVVFVPPAGKTEGDLFHGILECVAKMGHRPKVLYVDAEPTVDLR